MIFSEAQQALCRKLDIDYSDIANNGLFTLADIKDYVQTGAYQAWDMAFWDFAEHVKTYTLIAGDVTNGYVAMATDIAPSSIYYVTIDGKEFDKKNFASYKKWLEDNPTSTEKYWSEFKRMFFFNANAVSTGHVVDIYGKRNGRPLSADSDLMYFSPDTDNEEFSGNQAIITLAYAEALASEKKKQPEKAEIERKKGYGALTVLANNQKQGRAIEQSKNRPMFDVPNFFGASQGTTNVGLFTTN